MDRCSGASGFVRRLRDGGDAERVGRRRHRFPAFDGVDERKCSLAASFSRLCRYSFQMVTDAIVQPTAETVKSYVFPRRTEGRNVM